MKLFSEWLVSENSIRTHAKLGLYAPIDDALGQYPPLYGMPSAADLITYIDIEYPGLKIPGKDGIIRYDPTDRHDVTDQKDNWSWSHWLKNKKARQE